MNNMTLFSNMHQALGRGLALAVLVLLLASSVPIHAQTYSGNPILPGYKADPDILLANGKYYIYPTSSGGNAFRAYSSTDLTNWVDEGVIFDLDTDCSWASDRPWAPTVVYRNNQYYFYYSAAVKVGVAVSSSPTGPFVDKGSPLIGSDPFTSDIIDPDVFVDSDGKAYIYYGGSNGSKMVYRELNNDMVSLKTGAVNITPPNYTEAPLLVKRNGIYYMMYSNGAWYNGSYNVRYSTSSSPTGPWTYKGQVLSSAGAYEGPGHHGILKMPGCDEYYIIYHRWEDNNGSRQRRTAIDRLYFSGDGSIQPIHMINNGVLARPINSACQPNAPGSIAAGTYRLINQYDGGALTRAQQVYTPNKQGNYVISYPYTNDDEKHWKITLVGNGNYKLINQDDGKALTRAKQVYAPNKQGNYVITYPYTNNDKRHWKITPVGNGNYRLINQYDGEALTRAKQVYALNNQGNYAITYPYSDNDKRHWKLELVDDTNARTTTPVQKNTSAFEELSEQSSCVYPNPLDEKLQVHLPSGETLMLRLYDSTGKVVLEQAVSHEQTLAVEALPAGLYQAVIQHGTHIKHQKIIIQ